MKKRVSYGYEMRNGSIEMNIEQRKVVENIFQDYVLGNSIHQIYKKLNERGIPSPNNGNWSHGAVGRLLENKRYLGDELYPQIISSEIFQMAQELRELNCRKLGRDKISGAKRPYAGMVICAECGHRYRRVAEKTATRWYCGLRDDYKRGIKEQECCNETIVTDEMIESSFIKMINRIIDGCIIIGSSKHSTQKYRNEKLQNRFEEIVEEIDKYVIESVMEIILWISSEEYQTSENIADIRIREVLSEQKFISDFNIGLFRQIIKRVLISEDGMKFELKNGQIIDDIQWGGCV